MLLEPRIARRATWEKSAMYVPDGLEALESWDGVRERHGRVGYDFRSQDEHRVVFWMMDELGDGMFELELSKEVYKKIKGTYEFGGEICRRGDDRGLRNVSVVGGSTTRSDATLQEDPLNRGRTMMAMAIIVTA
jgi:hypothetical protein